MNDKAVILAHEKDYESARTGLLKAMAIKPSLSILNENLAKLTLVSNKQYDNFWDFWNSTKRKRYLAISMGILAVAIVVYGIIAPVTIQTKIPETTLTTDIARKKVTAIEKNITTETNEEIISNSTKAIEPLNSSQLKIPDSFLIIVGLIIFFILVPQLRTAKVGPVEVELVQIQIDSPNVDTTLNLTEDWFVNKDDYYRDIRTLSLPK